MSFPLHLSLALAADIDRILGDCPPAMTRSALLRRLLRAGIVAEGYTLSEDRASVREREWPAVRDAAVSCCSNCPALEDSSGWRGCFLSQKPLSETERHGTNPPDWCPLRAGPVVLRLELP